MGWNKSQTVVSLRRRNGFTMIELLVSISIIALLMAIILPVMGKARDAAKRVTCMSQMHQIGLITQAYCDDNYGQFPDFFYSFSAGKSGNLIILVKPKKAATNGFGQYQPTDMLICPADEDPATVSVLQNDDSIKDLPVSYAFNIDLNIKNTLLDGIQRPSDIATFYEGSMGGSGNGKKNIQGVYKGTEDFIDNSLDTRHSNVANIVFADWHVASQEEITSDQLADNYAPYGWSPGKGKGKKTK